METDLSRFASVTEQGIRRIDFLTPTFKIFSLAVLSFQMVHEATTQLCQTFNPSPAIVMYLLIGEDSGFCKGRGGGDSSHPRIKNGYELLRCPIWVPDFEEGIFLLCYLVKVYATFILRER